MNKTKHFRVMVLDLQLFADVTNATTSSSTGNNLSAEMKTFYDKVLLREAGPKLVHEQFGQKRDIPRGNGKTIEFRKFNQLPKALTALTEGVTPDGGALDATSLTATVAQYGYFLRISDVLDLTAIDNVIVEATQLLGSQAGVTMDTVVRNQLVAGNNVLFCPTVSNGTETAVTQRKDMNTTSQLTVKMIQKAATLLKNNNVPDFDGCYVAIIHPSVAYDLRKSKDWVEAHKYAATTELFNGEIGELHGMRFIEDVFAPVLTGNNYKNKANGATYACYAFGKDSFGIIDPDGGGAEMIVHDKSEIGGPLNQFSTIGYKFETNGATMLYPERMLRVMAVSSYSATDTAN